MINEIFHALAADPHTFFDLSFTSDTDLDNIEALHVALEDNGLEGNVIEDNGTHAVLNHPGHDFPVHVTSDGGGDFFTHQIAVFREDDA